MHLPLERDSDPRQVPSIVDALAKRTVSQVNPSTGSGEVPTSPALDHPKRRFIYHLIRDQDGACQSDLQRLTDMQRTTIKFHVQKLLEARLITAVQQGRRRYYFPSQGRVLRLHRALMAIDNDTQRRIVQVLRTDPTYSWRRLAKHLGVTPRTVRWHVERLTEANLIRVETVGRFDHYIYLDSSILEALDRRAGRAEAHETVNHVLESVLKAEPSIALKRRHAAKDTDTTGFS